MTTAVLEPAAAVEPEQVTKAVAAAREASEKAGLQHLYDLDDGAISCKGDKHDFPKLRPGRWAKNLSARPRVDGGYELVFRCPDCGTKRTRVTRPGGVYDTSIKLEYDYPKGYRAPRGVGLRKTDYTGELLRRTIEDIKARAK